MRMYPLAFLLIAAVPASAGYWRMVDSKPETQVETGEWISSAKLTGQGVTFTAQIAPTSSGVDRGKALITKGTWTIPPDYLKPGDKLSFRIDLVAEKVELGPQWQVSHHLVYRSLGAGGSSNIASTSIGTSEGSPRMNHATGEWVVPNGGPKQSLALSIYGKLFEIRYNYAWMEGQMPAGGRAAFTPPASAGPASTGTSATGTGRAGASSGAAAGGISVTYDEPAGAAFTGPEVELFHSGNDLGVSNGGKETAFTLNRPARITYLLSYHYNGGKGAPGGTLKIVGEDGATWGPWKVETQSKVYWIAHPNVNLPAGRYRVLDSDPATWSQNEGSKGQGHIILKGIWGTAAAKAPAKPTGSAKSLKDELTELKELLDAKLITQPEYDAKRAEILKRHGF